jgi:hypothetical protein
LEIQVYKLLILSDNFSPIERPAKNTFMDRELNTSMERQALVYSFETFDDFKILKVRVSEYFKYPDIMSGNKTVMRRG